MTTQIKPEMTDQPVGFRKLIGLVTRELRDDYAVLELTLAPEHMNSHGSVHGGIIATMIDHAGGVAGCYCEKSGKKKKAVTLSLTTSFLAPVSSGVITATGRKRSGGRRIFASTIEIIDETERLIAIGEGTYRYIDA